MVEAGVEVMPYVQVSACINQFSLCIRITLHDNVFTYVLN